MLKPEVINQTSSIGASWPPVASTYNRVRGFYDGGVVKSEDDLSSFAVQFDAYRLGMQDNNRLSIRIVTHSGSLAILQGLGVRLEGAIPLFGLEEDLVIAYTGWNLPGRTIASDHLAAHSLLLSTAVRRQVDTKDRVAELAQQGFSPKIINGSTSDAHKAALVPAFNDIYGTFGYNQGDVEEILLNPANTIAYIQEGNTVVSTSMAEHATIEIDDLGPLKIVEITEASTRLEYRQRGLYKAISGFLLTKLLEETQQSAAPTNAIYGESNLAMPGVIFAAHENGRRFSYFDGARFGINQPDFGILPQNFRVEDGAELRPYNDFALTYAPLR